MRQITKISNNTLFFFNLLKIHKYEKVAKFLVCGHTLLTVMKGCKWLKIGTFTAIRCKIVNFFKNFRTWKNDGSLLKSGKKLVSLPQDE